MQNKYKKSLTIRLDPELKGWLYTICQKENRSLSNLINTILKEKKENSGGIEINLSGQTLKEALHRADKACNL